MQPIMQYALRDCKRLLHYESRYAFCMMTPNQRLRIAREKAGFATAVEAADALGIARSTYIGHENGHRGLPAKKAPIYARKFKVTEEWLLYGRGPEPEEQDIKRAEVINIFDHIPAERVDQAITILKTFANERGN